MSIVTVFCLKSGSTSEYKRSMIRLMAVEIRICGTKHLWKHLWLSLRNQCLDQLFAHRDVNADTRCNRTAFVSGCQYNGFSFIHIFCGYHTSGFSFDLLDLDKLCAKLSGSLVKTEGCNERIGMSVGRAPAGNRNLIA